MNFNHNKESLRSLMLKGTGGTLILKITFTCLTFIICLILARLLGVKGYGIYDYSLAWIALLVIIAMMGFDKLLIRNVSAYHIKKEWGLIRGIMKRSDQAVVISSFVLMGLVAGISWIVNLEADPMFLYAFWTALLLIPLIALIHLRESILKSFHYVVVGQLPENLIKPLLFIVLIGISYLLLKKNFSARWALTLNVFATTISFLIISYILKKLLPESVEVALPSYDMRIWFINALPLLLVSGMRIINAKIDIIMLGTIKGTELAGIYSVATRGAGLINFVMFSVNAAFAPIIAKLYANGEMKRLQHGVTKCARANLLISLPIAFVLIIFGRFFLLLFGPAFTEGKYALAVLSIGHLFSAASGSVGLILIMTDYEREAAWGVCIGAIGNIALNSLLIPFWGLEGAAIATAISMILLDILLIWIVWKRLRINSTVIALGIKRI